MSDVEKIIVEALAGWSFMPVDIGGDVGSIVECMPHEARGFAEKAVSALRAAGYMVVKPEWEYGAKFSDGYVEGFHGIDPHRAARAVEAVRGTEIEAFMRRRKAGAWEPVEGEK